MLLAVDSIEKACEILIIFRNKITLLAAELFDHTALEMVIQKHKLTAPFNQAAAFYILFEYENSSNESETNVMQAFESCFAKQLICDGMVSQNEMQRSQFWHYREYISESIIDKFPFKCDLAIQPSQLDACANAIRKSLSLNFEGYTAVWFGHIGDGNIHLNILKPDHIDKSTHHQNFPHIAEKIYRIINEFHGSIAAEHGVGLLKKPYLPLIKSPSELHFFQSMKNAFDPNHILNPGKIFE